jgi:hypothetical protein
VETTSSTALHVLTASPRLPVSLGPSPPSTSPSSAVASTTTTTAPATSGNAAGLALSAVPPGGLSSPLASPSLPSGFLPLPTSPSPGVGFLSPN